MLTSPVLSQVSLEDKPPSYSVSRLNAAMCGQYYYHKYIAKIKVGGVSKSTIIGSLIHRALEVYLADMTRVFLEVFELEAPGVLIEYLVIDDIGQIYNLMLEYSRDIASLYYRASAEYEGDNPIRNKDGSISKSPSMSSSWKEAVKNLKLDSRRNDIEDKLLPIAKDGVRFLLEAYAEAYSLANSYIHPVEIEEVLALEFPISDWDYKQSILINPVTMPEKYGGPDIYFVAYIDLICFTTGHKLTIIDHKSSMEDVSENEVMFNKQLYAYVWAYEKLTGQQVERIGIHSFRHKKLVMVDVDRAIMQEVLAVLFSKHYKVNLPLHKEYSPDTRFSPCNSMFGRECDYLKYCYPIYWQLTHPEEIGLELAELLE